MKALFILSMLVALNLTSGCSDSYKMEKTANGLEYHFFNRNQTSNFGNVKDIYSLNVSVLNSSGEFLMKEFLMFERYISVFPGDFHEGLAMVKKGDSAVFNLDADSFFYQHGMVKPRSITEENAMIAVHIGVVNIQNPFEHLIDLSEKELIQTNQFVERKNWNVIVDSTGIQYEIMISNPEGEQVGDSNVVSLTYLYYTLDERIIQKSKEGDYWDFQVGDYRRITGLSRVLTFMKKGEKIRAILPFTEAYGAEGMQGSGFQIAPFTTIVIELEVHEINHSE